MGLVDGKAEKDTVRRFTPPNEPMSSFEASAEIVRLAKLTYTSTMRYPSKSLLLPETANVEELRVRLPMPDTCKD